MIAFGRSKNSHNDSLSDLIVTASQFRRLASVRSRHVCEPVFIQFDVLDRIATERIGDVDPPIG